LQRACKRREARHQDAQGHADQDREDHGNADQGDVLPRQVQDLGPIKMGKGVQEFHVFSSY